MAINEFPIPTRTVNINKIVDTVDSWLPNVAAVIADTNTYTDGTIIGTREEGFAYRVDSTATLGFITNSATTPQKLVVLLKGGNTCYLSAFGVSGASDIADAFDGAVDLLPNGGTIIVDQAYTTTRILNVDTDGIEILGRGLNTGFKTSAVANYGIDKGVIVLDADRCSIHNLTVDGLFTGTGGGSSRSSGIVTSDTSKDCTIRGTHVKNCTRHGYRIDGTGHGLYAISGENTERSGIAFGDGPSVVDSIGTADTTKNIQLVGFRFTKSVLRNGIEINDGCDGIVISDFNITNVNRDCIHFRDHGSANQNNRNITISNGYGRSDPAIDANAPTGANQGGGGISILSETVGTYVRNVTINNVVIRAPRPLEIFGQCEQISVKNFFGDVIKNVNVNYANIGLLVNGDVDNIPKNISISGRFTGNAVFASVIGLDLSGLQIENDDSSSQFNVVEILNCKNVNSSWLQIQNTDTTGIKVQDTSDTRLHVMLENFPAMGMSLKDVSRCYITGSIYGGDTPSTALGVSVAGGSDIHLNALTIQNVASDTDDHIRFESSPAVSRAKVTNCNFVKGAGGMRYAVRYRPTQDQLIIMGNIVDGYDTAAWNGVANDGTTGIIEHNIETASV